MGLRGFPAPAVAGVGGVKTGRGGPAVAGPGRVMMCRPPLARARAGAVEWWIAVPPELVPLGEDARSPRSSQTAARGTAADGRGATVGRLFSPPGSGGQGLAGVTFLSVPFTRTVTLLRFRARSAVTVYDVTLPLRHVQSTS